MRAMTSNSVLASEIAEFLGATLTGEDVVVYGPRPVSSPDNNSIVFTDRVDMLDMGAIQRHVEVLILCNGDPPAPDVTFIIVPDPKVSFTRVIDHYFARDVPAHVHPTAVVETGATIGRAVTLGAGCYIGPDVTIGDGTSVLQNVVIAGRTIIGDRCVIKPNCTVGSEIFDFVYGEDGWIQYPQIGAIRIGNDVWIGANSTVERGALTDTVLEDGVKIDDLVQVGSGSTIQSDSSVAAGTIICRDVQIGRRCWVAPRVVILERLTIADGTRVGVGTVVREHLRSETGGDKVSLGSGRAGEGRATVRGGV